MLGKFRFGMPSGTTIGLPGGPLSSLLWLSIYTVWFPNADIVMALLITAFYGTFIGGMYSLNVVAMPRSGSDYVFVSRTLLPAVGFGFSLILVVWIMMMNAWNTYLSFAFLSQTMYSIGAMTGSASLLSAWGAVSGSPLNTLITGVLIYIVSTVLVLFGLRRFMKYFGAGVNVLSIIGSVILIIFGLVYTNQDFIVRFNSTMSPLAGSPDPYHDIFKLAASLGYVQAVGYDWGQTLTVSVLWYLLITWPMASAWIGGEIKRANSARDQFLAMSGGQWFTCLACGVFIWFWFKIFDRNWLASLGYIALNHPDKIPAWLPGAAPYYQLAWVNILLGNVWLAAFVSAIWVLQAIYLISPLINGCSRHLFAWSFDRIVPSKLSDVSERWHSPILALCVIGVVTMIGYVFTVYTTYLNFAVGAPLGAMWAFLIVSIATVAFKWRRKDVYETSGLSRVKFAGLPVHTMLGVISVCLYVALISAYFGPLNPLVLGGVGISITEATAAIFIVAVVAYYVAKMIQEKRGVPLELVFKQIPPE